MSSSAERTSATAKIKVASYEPQTYEDSAGGTDLVEIHVTETFQGDIEGQGVVRFLQAMRPDGSASFCGIERVTGSVGGRTGTFLLQDVGTVEGSVVSGTWFVIPGSGTGNLAGLRGEGDFTARLGEDADVTLQYWFE